MNDLHTMTEADANTVARNVASIKEIADDLTAQGISQAFEVYKLARDTLEILAFDRISRDTLAKLGAGNQEFLNYTVSDQTQHYMETGQKIAAIRQFRAETGLGLMEAKTWVESYMTHHC